MKKKEIVKENQQSHSRLPVIIALSLLVILVGCYFILPGFKTTVNEIFHVLISRDEGKIEAWVEKFGIAGPFVLILVMIVQMFLFVVPNVFVMIVAIVSYGPFWGAVISFVGVFASSSVGYIIGKYLGPVTVDKLMSEKTRKKTSNFIRRYGVTAIAITRISSFSNDSLSIVAGLLKMNYRKYILATLGGITPLIVLLAIYGQNGKILKSLIWVAAFSLIILIVFIIMQERKRKLKTKDRIT